MVAPDAQRPYELGYRLGSGRALAVARPSTVDAVRQVVRYCYRHDIPFVAQGANTGLTGASVPSPGGQQLVISLEKLAGITDLNPADRSLTALSGTRLSQVNAAAGALGLQFPIDLGADPMVGGMVATNTGGARLIRYGDVRRNVLGIEAVLADEDASLLSAMRGLRKDNSGLDLKQLFIGSGGAFGVIVRAKLELHQIPNQTATAFVTPRSHQDVPEIIRLIEAQAGDVLAACEGLSRNAITAALAAHPALRNPFAAIPDYVLLVELATTASAESGLDLVELFTLALGDHLSGPEALVEDVVIAKPEEAWALRHAVSDGLKAQGRVIGLDIAVPRSRLPEFRSKACSFVAESFPYLVICDFGHCGDGGDHFNLVWPKDLGPGDFAAVSEAVRAGVYRIATEVCGGTFSAEHGLGPVNRKYYDAWTDATDRSVATLLKSHFDPKGLVGNVDFS